MNNLLAIKSYLAEFIDRHDTYHPFCRYVPLYETLFSCSDTTFIRMTKDLSGTLVPVFMESTPVENTRKTIVEHIQKGAVNYISEVVTILGEHFKHLDIEPNKTLRALNIFFPILTQEMQRYFQGWFLKMLMVELSIKQFYLTSKTSILLASGKQVEKS